MAITTGDSKMRALQRVTRSRMIPGGQNRRAESALVMTGRAVGLTPLPTRATGVSIRMAATTARPLAAFVTIFGGIVTGATVNTSMLCTQRK